MSIFYISDMHFMHKNILRINNRPFKDIDEMDKEIIKRWNEKVKESDTVYILGDVGFAKNENEVKEIINIVKTLKGVKYLIKGNHDNKLIRNFEFRKLFRGISNYEEINDNGYNVILFHYPIEEWNGFYRGSIHLFGHIHNNEENLKKIKNRYNVGVDVNNFTPMSLEELMKLSINSPNTVV